MILVQVTETDMINPDHIAHIWTVGDSSFRFCMSNGNTVILTEAEMQNFLNTTFPSQAPVTVSPTGSKEPTV